MPVSQLLEKNAKRFCLKYSCDFDFEVFESRVEEFTFLRPLVGWSDAYKETFECLYKNTLKKVVLGFADTNIDAEAMLDDFEYTLIRPYVEKSKKEIKHKPYAGMDKISRIAYLESITKEVPSNLIELYTEKYKKGELTIKEIKASSNSDKIEGKSYVDIAAYLKALENVNNERSFIWRAIHPLKNSAEKRIPELMKKSFVSDGKDGEEFYRKSVEAAGEHFNGYERVIENLKQSMVRAREELNHKHRVNSVVRESIRIEEFEELSKQNSTPCVESCNLSTKEDKVKSN